MYRLLFLILFSPSLAFAFWPVYFEFEGERHLFGPFFSYSRDERGLRLTIRPLLSTYDQGRDLRFLYPLGKISEQESYLIPFYVSRRSEDQSHWSFLLLFGGSSDKGRYWGFFPFFGSVLHNFGREEIDFALWPIYSHILDRGKETTHLFWPLFSVYRGKQKGFRCWPLIGEKEIEGQFRGRFLLWPLFYFEDNEEIPERKRFFFPVFLYSTSRDAKETYVLWPFFGHRQSDEGSHWKILWPLFSLARGRESLGISLFPLFSFHRVGSDRELSLFWPLFKQRVWEEEGREFSERTFLLLSGFKAHPEERTITLWPFFFFQSAEDSHSFSFPFILPLRSEEAGRILSPLMTIYELKAQGRKRTMNFLWGLFTEEKDEQTLRWRMAFLLDYERIGPHVKVKLLSGLVSIKDGRIERMLFLPIRW